MMKIAFIGLGNMGLPMAKNLVAAGYHLNVFDRVKSPMETLQKSGAVMAASAKEAVNGVDVIITMLTSDEIVERLYVNDEALLEHIKPNTLIIDCSTISPNVALSISKKAADKNLKMIDAPVSGGTVGAANATLSFMVGGNESCVKQAKPILETLGANVFHAGPNGAGQTAKICNNLLLAIQMIGTAEALQLGVDNGLNPETLSEIMLKSSGNNWCLENYNPFPGVMPKSPASNQYKGGFMVNLMAKDLQLANTLAKLSGNEIPLGSQALALYKSLQDKGKGELDFSSIQQLFTPN